MIENVRWNSYKMRRGLFSFLFFSFFFLFFFFFFFCFSLFKTTKICFGSTKRKFSTGKKHFTQGKKSGKMTLPPQKNVPVTPLTTVMILTSSKSVLCPLAFKWSKIAETHDPEVCYCDLLRSGWGCLQT